MLCFLFDLRWATMQKAVGKFTGYFAKIERVKKSGSNFKDHVQDASELYKEGTASASDKVKGQSG